MDGLFIRGFVRGAAGEDQDEKKDQWRQPEDPALGPEHPRVVPVISYQYVNYIKNCS